MTSATVRNQGCGLDAFARNIADQQSHRDALAAEKRVLDLKIEGKSVLTLFPPENREEAKRKIASISSCNPAAAFENMVEIPDGISGIRRLHWTLKAIFDQSASIVGYRSEVCDITERKKAEQALRESEKFNRRLVEHAPFGIAYLAEDGTIEYVNPAANRIAGLQDYEITEIRTEKSYRELHVFTCAIL